MSRETYTKRKEREAVRDRILDFAWKIARHTAASNMIRVERSSSASIWPRFRFSNAVSGHRCECGLQMVPFPTFSKRHGVMPTWACVVCNLPWVVETCERIKLEAAKEET